ncbi:uncharacterized protein [Diabrotica undecimpunctata]|uniref:uncharacterized protein n=1 Tax=Diabrotica undecimpunctata TaxID=50387 RepID=UPI003B639982
MPLMQSPSVLGNSKLQAENRFYALERKFKRDPILHQRYKEFLLEYIDLHYMTINKEAEGHQFEYFLPHHGVTTESSVTTKLRVVFDASAPTASGLSLNRIQAIGPVLQDDLLSITLRFRKYNYVMSSDIAKMYRQVLIVPEQRQLQKVLWRENPNDNLTTYTLNTVTYWQSAASYLVIRCLFSLAEEIQDMKPEIADIIKRDFYVDDLLTGASTGFASAITGKILETWTKLESEIPALNGLKLNRQAICKEDISVQLHGFTDTSKKSYGACIYLQSVNATGDVRVELMYAKSKVAPLKTLTIPCLKLSAMLLLARLFDKVKKSMQMEFESSTLWSDSTIALAWIRTSPNLQKTFTSNRVSEIQSLTENLKWRYISTHDNPADIVSRGLYPRDILDSEVWWHRPSWLISNKLTILASGYAQRVLGIPEKIIKLVKMTLKTDNRVRIEGSLTGNFEVKRVLKQRDPLSKTLFNLLLNLLIMRERGLRTKGMIYDNRSQVLAFVDGVVLMARTKD